MATLREAIPGYLSSIVLIIEGMNLLQSTLSNRQNSSTAFVDILTVNIVEDILANVSFVSIANDVGFVNNATDISSFTSKLISVHFVNIRIDVGTVC